MMKVKTMFCFLFLVVFVLGGSAYEKKPVAVSPGSERGVAVVGQSCPTFSWTAVSWAAGYKVTVFESVSTEALTYEEMEAMGSPVLSEEIRGPALSWTPSADERLRNADEDYVGFIAEDVPELVATKDRKGINTMDVVAVLTKVVKEQQKVIQEQKNSIQDQQEMNKKQQRIIMGLLERIEALEKEK